VDRCATQRSGWTNGSSRPSGARRWPRRPSCASGTATTRREPDEFARRYRAELREPERAAALQHLRDLAGRQPLTLLTAAKDPGISQAAVLADLLAP